jgi:threonine dehydrogenase-like Zn-dependent dehydrogenase
MAQVVEWLGDPAFHVDGIVTHTFDLTDWTAALEVASRGPAAACVKATLRPNPQIPLVGG